MNLSPDWVAVLTAGGIEAVHWVNVGSAKAPDKKIIAWAKSGGYVLLTHDLDFGAILASTGADSPSVIQLRIQDVTPEVAKQLVLDVIARFAEEVKQGVLISVDEDRARIRILPI
jgi:predicted nuclease of predicted toxin-antitoxin system